MTSQIRYRTLVDNLARIYDATKETRTGCLQAGLTKVLETIDPKSAEGWQQVKVDSMRLLRVWSAREDCEGDSTLADQILDALTDFATDEVPRLEITERPTATVATAAVTVTPPSEAPALATPVMDEATAIAVALAAVADEEEEDTDAEVEVEIEVESDTEEEEEDEDEEVAEPEPEVVAPAPTPVPASVPASAVEEEDEKSEAVTEEEEEEEAEVVEPESDSEEEAEEEEEEGVEVEKRTIRGRVYWLSSDGTLYAVTEDDEIGDEVGRIGKDGRPIFLAPK
jgi:hypothetical protein